MTRTAVVGSLLAGVLLADVVGLVYVSDRQQAEAAAAAAARAQAAADATWVAEVREVALGLLKARAPIEDAADFVTGTDFGPAVRYDVYVRGAAAADFADVADRLSAVSVPSSRQATHGRISAALTGMTSAVQDLADEQDEDIEDELRAFAVSAADWDRTVSAEVAADLPLATTMRPDAALTAAGQLFRWSSACASGAFADDGLTDPGDDDPAAAAALFEGYARHLDDVLTQLLAVPDGPDAVAVQRDLEPDLRGLRPAVGGLQGFGAALREQDADALEEAALLLDQLDPLYEKLARSFEVRGSSVCSNYFDPGLLVDPRGADDVTTT